MAYVKPGVYSKYVRTPGSVKVSAGTRVVAIIGEGLTYFTVNDEAVTRSVYAAPSSDSLENTASEIISIGDYAGGNNYTENVDYELSESGGVSWLIDGDAPVAGAVYYVTYKYDKVSTDYDAQLFTKMSDIENEYGKESISNTISLGAKIAFENGANYIIGVQVESDTDSDFISAIDKLQYKIGGVNPTIIVPLSTSNTVQNYLKAHVEFMSSQFQRKERFGIIGVDIGTSFATVKAKGEAFGYNRIIFPWDEVTRDIRDPDTGIVAEHTLDSTFLACAIAGMMIKYPVQEPLTRKTVTGFKATVKANTLLETEKDTLAGAGVTLLEENGGVISIRHGMTTDTSSAEDNEISVMLIRDNTILIVRDALDKLYIAKVGTAKTTSDINRDLVAVLSLLVEDGSLTGFGDIVISQNVSDATRYDLSFRIDPAYPINYIYITFTI